MFVDFFLNYILTFIIVGIYMMVPLFLVRVIRFHKEIRTFFIVSYGILTATSIIWALVDNALNFQKLIPQNYLFNMLLHSYWINMVIGFSYMERVIKIVALPVFVIIVVFTLVKKYQKKTTQFHA